MHLLAVLTIAFLSLLARADTSTLSLVEALRTQADASKFADFLEANPEILAEYNSTSVQTIFAPADTYYTALKRRASSEQQRAQMQYADDLTQLEQIAPIANPGAIIHTGLPAPQAGGTQVIVSEKLGSNSTTRRRRQAGGIVPTTGIRLKSGQGNSVNILRGDIPYCNGVIHSTDGFFTVPTTLSSTLNSTGLSTLSTLLTKTNQTSSFDTTTSITIFTPSNAAFTASNSTSNPSTLPNLLNNHVIPNFLGYLPALKDGATYQTLANETLRITVKNGVYYVNGARIVKANTIIENGVAHVIDSVLVPSPTLVYIAGAATLFGSTSAIVAVAVAMVTTLVMW